MIDEPHEEHTEFPTAGARARRWSRFERDLYEWMNRPEGQFECWLAKRRIASERQPEAAPVAAASADGDE